jgi:hypothetical protein
MGPWPLPRKLDISNDVLIELELRSQSPREKLGELFDEQFRKMFRLIDEQIHLLGTKYPNEHLVSAGGSARSLLTSPGVYGPIWWTRFLTIYPEAAPSAVRHCCGSQLSQRIRHANLACRTTVSNVLMLVKDLG